MRALMIREDVPPSELRRLAKAEDDPRAARRRGKPGGSRKGTG
jgi:hypothetical protein